MNDQEKRGNVIKALELCTSKIETRTRVPCEICPYHNEKYHGVHGDGCCNMRSLQRDMLALLKAQEPRVMTLDELSEKTDVWFESLVYDTIDPALSSGSYDDGTVGLMTLEEELFYLDEADYGTKWRCWTSCPTDEQREKEPWKGQA